MEKATILSIKNLSVKFKTRSSTLKVLRNISFNIYAGETLAIVGESGSGKSVLTKTFTNSLEPNGWINNGLVVYNPIKQEENKEKNHFQEPINLIDFHKILLENKLRSSIIKNNEQAIKLKEKELIEIKNLNIDSLKSQLNLLEKNEDKNQQNYNFTKINKFKQTKINKTKEQISKIKEKLTIAKNNESKTLVSEKIKQEITEIAAETSRFKKLSWNEKKFLRFNINLLKNYQNNKSKFNEQIKNKITLFMNKKIETHDVLTRINKLNKSMFQENSLNVEDLKNIISEWEFIKKPLLVSKYQLTKKLSKLRGGTIATIFQDPTTSLNPLLSVGFQISEVLIKHQNLSRKEAKKVAIELLTKVGISNAKKRYHNLPGMYSGGMRQRVVIAIALACQPQILICDEPTTALDVTIQAQILDLIKNLQKEFKFTIIFITHDLGVVANIADRVAVMYAGQIIEYGKVNEIFFNPKHPYTWDLLLSLPQFATKNEQLHSIPGSPPSLYSEIKGDAFAPRNKFAMKIDYLHEPPFFKISDTHYAKTWLCHPQAPKIKRPNLVVNNTFE